MTSFSSVRSNYIQSAYAKGVDHKGTAPENTVSTPEEAGGFSQLVTDAATQAIDTVRSGDRMVIAGLSGQAGLQQVVEATMAMESTVQISVALRDKLVEAYQEVMRMPV